MASPSAITPDTPVALKVSYAGTNRRFKLPLRDLGANTLEDKLRGLLMIQPGTDCLFERYSDSAASYVLLDRTNQSVYKQLYRAAKAKQKLKLRVTVPSQETEEEVRNVPRPVTVEDEPEPSQPAIKPEPESVAADEPIGTPSSATAPCLPPMSESSSRSFASDLEPALRKSLAKMERDHTELSRNLGMVEASFADLYKKYSMPDDPDASSAAEPQQVAKWPVMTVCGTTTVAPHRPNFAVCCNSCDKTVPEAHYHCSTCDGGDFDLCSDCVDRGITCHGAEHWLIKRFVRNGTIINSTTERIAPKPKAPQVEQKKTSAPAPIKVEPVVPGAIRVVPILTGSLSGVSRTCNSCVREFREEEFVHCTACDDFDLCQTCFVGDQHGHNPRHGFVPAVENTISDFGAIRRLAPGRNQRHNAICDGCDKYIVGVRHKCLQCPDWDYCANCVVNAGFIHPDHRFATLYEPLEEVSVRASRPTHYGICCDGPLCSTGRAASAYIVGDRYKCAVCNDTDFCANCEASPANTHNKTHPLIKFKTPVRHVSVTTTGEREDGRRMPAMGDRLSQPSQQTSSSSSSSRATAETTTLTNLEDMAATPVQTVVDVRPTENAKPVQVVVEEEEEEETKKLEVEMAKPVAAKAAAAAAAAAPPTPAIDDGFMATFERDTVADGTVLPPNHVFEQTWTLRNTGSAAWPAGCAVKFIGGDYMGHVDPNHPAGISELVSASESTVCYEPLEVGQNFSFTVLLRTPSREGKVISYWRLTSGDGLKFGHRLWCDVDVKAPEDSEDEPPEPAHESQMIFPKLEKESPVSSIHQEDAKSAGTAALSHVDEASPPSPQQEEVDDFEDCAGVDEWAEGDSVDGYLTDEEYDILDAEDEE